MKRKGSTVNDREEKRRKTHDTEKWQYRIIRSNNPIQPSQSYQYNTQLDQSKTYYIQSYNLPSVEEPYVGFPAFQQRQSSVDTTTCLYCNLAPSCTQRKDTWPTLKQPTVKISKLEEQNISRKMAMPSEQKRMMSEPIYYVPKAIEYDFSSTATKVVPTKLTKSKLIGCPSLPITQSHVSSIEEKQRELVALEKGAGVTSISSYLRKIK